MSKGTEVWSVEKFRESQKSKSNSPKKKSGNGDKAKAEIEIVLKLSGLQYEKELVFAKPRKFRFDFAIPSLMLAVEYEGIMVGQYGKSRHTSITGYSKDTEKYNLAAKKGWRIFRYTAINYKQLSVDLNEYRAAYGIVGDPALLEVNESLLEQSPPFFVHSTKKQKCLEDKLRKAEMS